MKVLYLYLSLFVLLIACYQKKRVKMIENLTNSHSKCWYHYYRDTLKSYDIGFCINIDGTYKEYDRTEKSFNVSFHPLNPIPVWKILNDSTMMFGDSFFYKIISLNADSIILENVAFKDSYLKLHKDSIIPH